MTTDAAKTRFISIAHAYFDGKLHIVEACRQALPCLHELAPCAEPSTVIVAFASETDDFPTGHVRNQWNADALAEADAKLHAYIHQMGDGVEVALRTLVAYLSR